MTLSPRDAELLELCIHEAGHAVAGVVLGGRLAEAHVMTWPEPRGGTAFDALPAGRDAQVAFAGCWAQARWRAGRRPTGRDVAAVLRGTGCRDDTVLTAAGGPAVVADGEVEALLSRCWPAVITVARVLNTRPEVHHGDVCKALGVPAGDNGHELALIRAGSAPGSFTVTAPVTV